MDCRPARDAAGVQRAVMVPRELLPFLDALADLVAEAVWREEILSKKKGPIADTAGPEVTDEESPPHCTAVTQQDK